MPSYMNLGIRSGTVGYNNKILVSDGKFSLGKNSSVPMIISKEGNKPKISHEDIKVVVQPTLTKS